MYIFIFIYLEVLHEGQFLVLLHYAKVDLNGRRYENRSMFFSLVPKGKGKKISFQNVHFWLFKNRSVKAVLSYRAASKTITFSETTWKVNSTVPTFHIFVVTSPRDKLDLKIGTTFSKIMNFLKLRLLKNDPIALALSYVDDSVNVNICSKV